MPVASRSRRPATGLYVLLAIVFADVVANLNTLVYENSASNRYATFFYAEFDASSRLLRNRPAMGLGIYFGCWLLVAGCWRICVA